MKSKKRLIIDLAFLAGIILVILVLLQGTGLVRNKSVRSIETTPRRMHAKLRNNADRFGLKYHDPSRAYQGVTLYPVSGTAEILLLTMEGKVGHKWDIDADRARLLPNCNLLVVHGSKWGAKREPWKSIRPIVREYDWNGEAVWEYHAPDFAHHDIRRLSNGNTIFLYRTIVEDTTGTKIKDPILRKLPLSSDSIVEVTPTGEVVWEWHVHDHLDWNSCGRARCRYGLGEGKRRGWDWSHVNTIAPIPPNQWYDAGDERFKPGNLFFLPRSWWTAMIIERATGKIIWKYGGENYPGGLMGGHEVHMIPRGLPGGGNVLLFDNGVIKKRNSMIIELNPVTKEIVWRYAPGKSFFNRAAGSVQRLPNGNTFISSDIIGRSFEVTLEKEIVWEYRGKYRTSRAHRYSYNHCPKLGQFAT